jgi:hypothetical protein
MHDIHFRRAITIQVTRYWMLEKKVPRAAQAIGLRFAVLLFIRSTEYLINPVTSILVDCYSSFYISTIGEL